MPKLQPATKELLENELVKVRQNLRAIRPSFERISMDYHNIKKQVEELEAREAAIVHDLKDDDQNDSS